MTRTVTVDLADLRSALDDWAGCYDAEGFSVEGNEVYDRLRKLVDSLCEHPMEDRTRRRDGSRCRACGKILLGEFKP